ncbi:hypothetical protein [Curtobacterium sp. VKM Ac-2922]|uniref:hypothetical protein n=1 Tax=Curtobacterium sp. VKM Ac-2922 TaxID=2929475 RepID=UPI001FB1C0B3|nr:hypothetical protein [Curtobacterium sp. VKM Ac-2922]MCJ1714919.1 hypothetical protein [Curtobacterium sp. VKM Ac-2922]
MTTAAPLDPRPRRGAAATAIAVALAVATCVAASLSMGALGTPSADAAPVAQAASASGAFLAGCGSEAVASPLTVPIWCASSDQVLQDLTWSAWGGTSARGVGSFVDNPCDCASGQLHRYAVAVSLDDQVAVAGTTRYERLRITFANGRPGWASRPTMSFRWSDQGFVTDQVLS